MLKVQKKEVLFSSVFKSATANTMLQEGCSLMTCAYSYCNLFVPLYLCCVCEYGLVRTGCYVNFAVTVCICMGHCLGKNTCWRNTL